MQFLQNFSVIFAFQLFANYFDFYSQDSHHILTVKIILVFIHFISYFLYFFFYIPLPISAIAVIRQISHYDSLSVYNRIVIILSCLYIFHYHFSVKQLLIYTEFSQKKSMLCRILDYFVEMF